MILRLIDGAVAAGARLAKAAAELGLSLRTIERWRSGAVDDLRRGPLSEPANKLSQAEREQVLAIVNSPEYRDLSPKQIVPLLADEDRFVASESTMYRLLRDADLLQHRERSRAPTSHPPKQQVATGPNQVWSWDITYLRSPVAGAFFYLYMVVDVWSRRIMAYEVHATESPRLASEMIERTCRNMGLDPSGLVLHSDNGGPMKGSTMLSTLQRLGIVPSFSRPRVSDDNPYSEALFRTLKYCPEYPTRPFADLPAARAWVERFVGWYNTEHLHSGIRFVSPEARHTGAEKAILEARRRVYERAKAAHPERWTKGIRCWNPVATVLLNPQKHSVETMEPNIRSGGLGAAAPSGAGQSPVEALPNAAGASNVPALKDEKRTAPIAAHPEAGPASSVDIYESQGMAKVA